MLWGTGCATDPEYSQKLATARTDWTGKEIVGVWVSQLRNALGEKSKIALLIRPDGTGIRKVLAYGFPENPLDWTYAGSGVWRGEVHTSGHEANHRLIFHYNSSELLCKDSYGPFTYFREFVRGDNEAAVGEHLKRR